MLKGHLPRVIYHQVYQYAKITLSASLFIVRDAERGREQREIFIDNLLVRVHLIIEMSRPALRHGSVNSLFQEALYLPS